MRTLSFTCTSQLPMRRRAHVGAVASGDLEIVMTPAPGLTPGPAEATVVVRTSVDGYDTVWRRVLDRFFSEGAPAGHYEVNDFGATPGMVSLRLAQAREAADTAGDAVPEPAPVLPAPAPRPSFGELTARERVRAVLDPGTFRELLGPFEGPQSPHLVPQGVVPQSDDGAVVGRGTLEGADAVVLALDGAFQGGGVGEVSGAKLAAALDLAAEDRRRGLPIRVVLLLDTGGIRLQEANLGLLAVAEIHASLVRLSTTGPVVGVIAGPVGCFGGMGIAAALTSHLIMTRGGRLGLNGPEVIETEAGPQELEAADRTAVWAMIGGAQRVATGQAERLVEDTVEQVAEAVREVWRSPAADAPPPRTARIAEARRLLAALDPTRRPTPADLRTLTTAPTTRGTS
ncbi:biotin-independent malonate decarboxylase subunit beta [Streptomyces sp. NBC_01335]|uniref:biotin-independent malonate decarboxylase subunit beta n=1 Tax=Streptomyces sp. NBC_01335 TaxID=2903828 RepID=UPI002E0DAA6D|nr:biotin-independent malonate decarboxylase subunit beta [Streptomyces sp. NBC_01335]